MVTAFCGNAPFSVSKPLTATRSYGILTRFLFEPFGTSEFRFIVAYNDRNVKKSKEKRLFFINNRLFSINFFIKTAEEQVLCRVISYRIP